MTSQLTCFWALVNYEWVVFKKNFIHTIIDLLFGIVTNIIVFAYIFPTFMKEKEYGIFIFVALMPLFAFFDAANKAVMFIFDLQGPKTYSYKLLLPISSTGVFLSTIVGWALLSFLMTIILYPVGAVMLWKKFNILDILNFKFFFIYILISLFYGTFGFWLASLIKKMQRVTIVWLRVVNPLFMIGCYFYTWHAVYEASKPFAYLHLINPLVYIMEGVRAASMGQTGFINYWVCVSMLIFFIVSLSYWGMKRLKSRLDCL